MAKKQTEVTGTGSEVQAVEAVVELTPEQQIIASLQALNVKKASRKRDLSYEILRTGDVSQKLPKQAVQILALLFETGNPVMTDAEVIALVNTHPELSKKQTPERIFRYYCKTLCDAGWLSKVKKTE